MEQTTTTTTIILILRRRRAHLLSVVVSPSVAPPHRGSFASMTPSHTQLSRPIPLGCFTPWNPDDGASARGLYETFLYRVQLLKPIACFAQSFFQPTTEMAAIGNPKHPYME